MQALTTSPRLCGGTSVAMPTAMPVVPLSSRCGSRAGIQLGSSSVPSKFGTQSRSEEHTSELQVTNAHLVCRLLLEKKNNKQRICTSRDPRTQHYVQYTYKLSK